MTYVNSSAVDGIYKMRGWHIAGATYYYWTTTDPEASPPPGAPSLIDIAIAAILVEPSS